MLGIRTRIIGILDDGRKIDRIKVIQIRFALWFAYLHAPQDMNDISDVFQTFSLFSFFQLSYRFTKFKPRSLLLTKGILRLMAVQLLLLIQSICGFAAKSHRFFICGNSGFSSLGFYVISHEDFWTCFTRVVNCFYFAQLLTYYAL